MCVCQEKEKTTRCHTIILEKLNTHSVIYKLHYKSVKFNQTINSSFHDNCHFILYVT